MSLLSWIDYNKKEGGNSKQRSTMNAVRYYGPNKPLGFDVVDKPSAETLGDDEIIVQVKAAALCHTELHFADGTLDIGVKPMTLGHETAGVIVATGSKVPKTRLNERVILYYYVGCGRVGDDNSKSTPSPSECCRWCQQGQEQICPNLKAEYGFISDGGLAEFVKLPARNAVPLPESISFQDAAPIGCGLTTAVHAAKMARMSITSDFKETALVYGCNGVGFGLVQLLKNVYKCEKVIVVTRSESKRQKALELGADVVIDGTQDPAAVASAVRDASPGGGGVDVIFECVGRNETMNHACVGWAGALGRRGRLVLIGYHAGSDHDFRCHPIPLIVYEQSIIGSVGATLTDLQEAVEYVSNGQLSTVIDSVLPLRDFQKGLDKIKNCSCVGKIVCIP